MVFCFPLVALPFDFHGCDGWFTVRVTTCGEFDRALKIASQGDRGAYIEVVNDKYAAPPLALKLHESVKTLPNAVTSTR
jgi:indolepyruvate decarboxylase